MNKQNLLFISYIKAIIAAILGIALDQWTKFLVLTELKGQKDIVLIKDVFRLHYLENRGAAFGIMQGQKLYFIISGLLIIGVIAFLYQKMPVTKRYQPLRICSVLLVAGAVGNMIDRIRLEYVVDFLYFELIDFPVFNVADIYVTVGTFVLVILILFYYKEEDLECFRFQKK